MRHSTNAALHLIVPEWGLDLFGQSKTVSTKIYLKILF